MTKIIAVAATLAASMLASAAYAQAQSVTPTSAATQPQGVSGQRATAVRETDAVTPVVARTAPTTPQALTAADKPSMGHAWQPDVDDTATMQPMEKLEKGRGVVLRTLLGLLAVFTLAWLAAHPAIRKIERTLGFEHVVGAGLPFVFLGLLLRSPWVGVLDDDVLHHLAPLFEFGLGWLGFLVGFRFKISYLDRLPRGMPSVIAAQTTLPFIAVLLGCGSMMIAFSGDLADTAVIRDAIVLAAASAMTAARGSTPHNYASFQTTDHDVVSLTEQLDEIAAVVALLLLTAYFRPEGDAYTWQLPGTAWIFIALGMGVALGAVVHIMLRQEATSSEFLAITLGSVAFAAGMADYLWLSPIVVCFTAGAMVANLPLAQNKEQLWEILARVEWPLYLVFLTCVGAFWDITDWRGWLLVPVFVGARLFGKWLSTAMLSRTDIDHGYNGLLAGRTIFARLSGLSIAMVVSWESLYGGPSGRWIVTAIVGGAIVLELLAHSWERSSAQWLKLLKSFGSAAPPDVTGAFEPVDVSGDREEQPL